MRYCFQNGRKVAFVTLRIVLVGSAGRLHYEVSVDISAGRGVFYRTAIVTFAPLIVLLNKFPVGLEVQQVSKLVVFNMRGGALGHISLEFRCFCGISALWDAISSAHLLRERCVSSPFAF